MRVLPLLLILSSPLLGDEPPKPAQVMGLLKSNCVSCHSSEKLKGGLSLETREAALKGGDNGPSLVPGHSAESRLVMSLAEDADPHMPPKKQMPAKHIALLRAWVDAGAPWDEAAFKSFGEVAAAEKLGPLPASPTAIIALAISPDGTKLAVGRANHVIVYDVSKPERPTLATLAGHKDVVQSLAWSPDGKILVSGGYRSVLAFNTSSWTQTQQIGAPLEGRITALTFLPDNNTLIIADGAPAERGIVHFWSLSSNKSLAKLEGHSDNILAMAISPDGKLLATGGADNNAKVWDVSTRQEIAKLEGHTSHVMALAFNPDGTQLATGGADKELKVWDVRSKEQLIQLGKKSAAVTGLRWSADGSKLHAISDLGEPAVYTELKSHDGVRYNAEAGKESKLTAAGGPLFSLATSSDASVLYAGSESGTLLVWDKAGKVTPFTQVAAGSEVVSAKPASLSFTRDILPILNKAGCNLGSCHAKASGQAGFKLSVFAYDPKGDFRELTQDARGRRIFPALPEESLVLRKATGTLRHEGGQRFEPESEFTRTISEWIRQGSPYEVPGQPALVGISVSPEDRRYAKNESTQLTVTARFGDGSSRDVTSLADFTSNEKGVASVSESGEVRTTAYSGEAVIITRYLGQVAIARVNIPTDKVQPAARYAALPVHNEIDRLSWNRLQQLGYLPSNPCSDGEFLRRTALDATGTLPSVEEARAYLTSKDPEKAAKWLDHLLASSAWADHWTVKFADLLRPNPSRVGVKPVFLMDEWIRQSFRQNKPWDVFVRELLTSQGGTHQDGRVAFFRDKREPEDAAGFVSQIFLGVRMECAKCHHHPSERWDQRDYYEMAAFFTRMKHKGQGISAPISGEPEYWWFSPGAAGIPHPVTAEALVPRALASDKLILSEDQDPRLALVNWMTTPENPFFAKAIVNRVWSHFFGKGIVDPVDDFRASNPPSNGPLLDWLAQDFIAHKFDLKHLMRTIMSSHLYQLSSLPNETNTADLRNFSRSQRRRLPAEALLDAVCTVTETCETFDSLPPNSFAREAWNVKQESQFLDAFGRPNASAECPCERDAKPSVVQALHLMNSTKLQARLVDQKGRGARLAKGSATPEQIVEELYLAAFSRFPTPEEKEIAAKVIGQDQAKVQGAIEDVMWALLNSAEFVFNH